MAIIDCGFKKDVNVMEFVLAITAAGFSHNTENLMKAIIRCLMLKLTPYYHGESDDNNDL